MLLQNVSIMQVIAGNIVMEIPIVKMVCECFTVMTEKPALDVSSVFNIYVSRFIWIEGKFIFEDILAF